MPFVGQGVTGNPKRLFVSSKDRIVFNTGDPDTRANMMAIKDGFTQVERALNTRAVAAKCGAGPNFTAAANLWTTYLFGPVLWDSGKMVNLSNNSIVAIEPGIYHCVTNVFTGATGVFIRILWANSANIIQDFETFSTAPNSQIQFTVLFAAKYRDLFAVQVQAGSTPSTGCAMASFSVTKLCDNPSRYGQ